MNKKISQLTAGAPAQAADEIPAARGASNVKLTVADLALYPAAVTAVASEAIAAGNWVNLYNNAGTLTARKADATNNTKPAHAFALIAVSSAATGTFYTTGQNIAVTGRTVGATQYLSTTPGASVETAPTGASNLVQKLGTALGATVVDATLRDQEAPNDGDIYVRVSLSWLRCTGLTGTDFTRFGRGALASVTSGLHNHAFGDSALYSVTTATDNTAFGYHTGINIVNGGGNTLFGNQAGQTIVSGSANTLIGYKAGGAINGNNSNTVVGREAMENGNGQSNTAVGDHALRACYGNENTATGVDALIACTDGGQNVAVGHSALNGLTSGYRATAIGFQAGAGESRYESCYFGKGSSCTGDYQVQLGGSGTTPYAYASLQIRSDSRDKIDIRPLPYGLAFLDTIKVREFRRNLREAYVTLEPLNEEEGSPLRKVFDAESHAKATKAGTRYHAGVVAQEVKAAADVAGIDFSGFQDHSRNGGEDCYSVSMEAFVPALIKAVQELSARVKELESRP